MILGWLAHPERSMPVVVLSEFEGEILHPAPHWQVRVVERLFGMALVIRMNANLSWAITQQKGKQWSCYHGAVRIYWPKLDFASDPFRHDLMIAEDILSRFGTNDRKVAADRLLEYLYARFSRISTYSVRCPSVFPDLRRASSQERITDLRKQVTAKRDATKVTASLKSQNNELQDRLTRSQELVGLLTEETERLERELTRVQNEWDNERLLRGTAANDKSQPIAQQQEQLTTVAEAVERARQMHSDALIFGEDVDAEVKRLEEDAGPPSRVFNHLSKLAEASRVLQKAIQDTGAATLGRPICDWLTAKGAQASGEHQKTMEGKGKKERTWDFGDGKKHVFENHTKPNDATSPNRCVRIYFAWCDIRRRIVVGSVGRKPGL